MKSVGTVDANRYSRRVGAFGADHVVLIALESSSGSLAEPTIDRFVEPLLDVEGVVDVIDVPDDDPRLWVAAVPVEETGSGGGYDDAVKRLLEAAQGSRPSGARLRAAGQPVAEVAIAEGVSRETRRVLPWVVVVLAVLLLARYGHPGPAFAALAPALAGIAWTEGLYVLAGFQLNPIAALRPPVLLTVGVAASVHLVEAFTRRRGAGELPAPAVAGAVREVAFPAGLAAVTTAAGFLTLVVHVIPAVSSFGLFTGFGVALTALFTFALAPAVLVLAAPAGGPLAKPSAGAPRSARWGAWSARLITRRRRVILLAGSVLVLASGAAWTGISVDTHPIQVLPEDHPVRRDFTELATRLGAVEAFDVWIPADSPAASSPPPLDRVRRSLVAHEEVLEIVRGPRSGPKGSVLITAALAPGGTGARAELFDRIDRQLRRLAGPGAFTTGMAVRLARDSERLVRDQALAFALTLAVLLVAGGLGFRSWRLGALGVVPNILPCLALYAALTLLGRPVSVATAMIGSVMLGLIVDDTIHLLVRYRRARLGGSDGEDAVRRALIEAGVPISLTSVVLIGGFLVPVIAGRLVTTIEFGAVAAATIGLAFFTDLLLLPAILVSGRRSGSETENPA
jgi:predicted RND superfamily exporter protein